MRTFSLGSGDPSQLFLSWWNAINCNKWKSCVIPIQLLSTMRKLVQWKGEGNLHGFFFVPLQKWIRAKSSKLVQPQHSLIPTVGTLCPCGSWDGTPRHHLTVGWSSLGHPRWPELHYSGGKHTQSTDTSNQSEHNHSTEHPAAHLSDCSSIC